MRGVFAVVLILALAPAALLAQQEQPPSPPSQQPPAAPAPAPASTPPTAPAAASSARTFTAPAGIILNAVRPERVADFEKLIGYLQAALAASSDATVRAQAEGWRVLKASETGPNGVVLYVFLFDPTVTGADYGLGRILAAAYPDQTKLQEIWKLYTDSLASGGSLLNLTPLKVPEPQEQVK
jgi:pyruvate/2-oxoglutarate dehydrogenase complex dihydrolipoamide acyltransferase (E2) component